MIILENPGTTGIMCVLSIIFGLMIRLWVQSRRFNRRSASGSQLFNSYFHALLIRFIEGLLLVISVVLTAVGLLVLVFS